MPALLRTLRARVRFVSVLSGRVPVSAAAVDRAGRAPLAAVLLLERAAPDAPVSWSRLAPAEAFPLVLEHAYCFSLHDEARKRRMMDRYLDLADRVPVVSFSYPSGFEALGRVVDAVLEAADFASRAPAPR